MPSASDPAAAAPVEPDPVAKIRLALGERGEWLREQRGLSRAARLQTTRDLEDAGRREQDTQRDYVGRYPVELLQNAHDACADARTNGAVAYVLTEKSLIVANEGAPFDAKRIGSLVRQGMSEKARRRRRRTIGYKGVGFSSVFEISAMPQVITSSGIAFGFDRARAVEMVGKALSTRPETVAARNFPFELDDADWAEDAGTIQDLFSRSFVSAIRLPLRAELESAAIEEHITDLLTAETLVFLPAIRRIELIAPGMDRSYQSSNGNRVGIGKIVHVDEHVGGTTTRTSWLTRATTVPVDQDEIDALDDPAWADVAGLRAGIGLPWKNRTVTAARGSRIHLYFPTNETTGRGFLIHGDFNVDSGRSRIFTTGAAGALNLKLANAIADLAAELGESIAARHAPGLLGAFAKTGDPSPYGQALNQQLITRLRQAKIVRPAYESPPRVASGMRFVSNRDDQLDRRLLALMTKRADIVRVEDHGLDETVELLRALGVHVPTPTETAERVSVARSGLPYERALELLLDWIEDDSRGASEIITVLRAKKIVKDVNGHWCPPVDVVLSSDGVPPLPAALQRLELAPVRSERANEFFHAVEIEDVGPAEALAYINQALDAETFGISHAERHQLHDWLRDLHRTTPTVVKPQILRGRAPVPARSADGETTGWAYARAVYFGREWNDIGSELETLYGADDEPRFVSNRFGTTPALRTFYTALGAASRPRVLRVNRAYARDYEKWRQSPDVTVRAHCPNGHTQSPQTLVSLMIEDLDRIVGRASADIAVADALQVVLASFQKPYGDDATFTCENGNHRGNARPRPVPSYQRWQLRRKRWMHVANDPLGKPVRGPLRVWGGIPASQRSLLLPRPHREDATDFDLIPWERPNVAGVEAALAEVRQAFPNLAVAPAHAIATADVLLSKLEGALQDSTPRDQIWLPGRRDSARAWVRDGVVLDLPGVDDIPVLPVVNVATGSRVRAAYQLDSAQIRVTEQITVGLVIDRPPLLGYDKRAGLIAYLGGRGRARELARRLAVLHEQQVTRIDVSIALPGGRTHAVEDLPFKLSGSGDHVDLYVNDPKFSHLLRFSAVLADYLGIPERSERLALALGYDEVLSDVLPQELDEARELLDREMSRLTSAADEPQGDDAVTPPPDGDGSNEADDETRTQASRSSDHNTPSNSDPSSNDASPSDRAPSVPDPEAQRLPRSSQQPAGYEPSSAVPSSRPPSSPPPDGERGRVSDDDAEPIGEGEGEDGGEPSKEQRRGSPENGNGRRGLEGATARPRVVGGLSVRGTGLSANFGTRDSTLEPRRLPDPASAEFGDPLQFVAEPPIERAHATQSRAAPPDAQERERRERRSEFSERDAVDYVCEYARRVIAVADIVDRQRDRCGWDLEFVHADGKVEYVEVKGSTGLGPFELTRNELERSLEHGSDYTVYYLAQQATDPVLLRFDNVGSRIIDDEHLRAASWAVIGWRALNPFTIPVRLPK